MSNVNSTVGQELSIVIARMTEHDLLEVVEIEQLSGLSQWGWDAYYRELRSGEGASMLVARIQKAQFQIGEEKRIAGFIVTRVVADEMHINNVAVRSEFRQKGIGAGLLRLVLQQGRKRGARTAYLEVRAGNQAAQRLYQSCGFKITGRRQHYYREPAEDAFLMSCAL